MIKSILLVFLGGGAGSALRFGIQKMVGNVYFPFATFAVNIVGCFIAGVLFSLYAKHSTSDEMKAMMIAGFCGGFTTFSAFSIESVQLYKQNSWHFIIYVVMSLVICLLATFLGMRLIK